MNKKINILITAIFVFALFSLSGKAETRDNKFQHREERAGTNSAESLSSSSWDNGLSGGSIQREAPVGTGTAILALSSIVYGFVNYKRNKRSGHN